MPLAPAPAIAPTLYQQMVVVVSFRSSYTIFGLDPNQTQEATAKHTTPRSYTAHGLESAMVALPVTELELYHIRPYYLENRLRCFAPPQNVHPISDHVHTKTCTCPLSGEVGLISKPFVQLKADTELQEQTVRLTVFEMANLNEYRWDEWKRDRLVPLNQGKTGADLEKWKEATVAAAKAYLASMKKRTEVARKKKNA